MTTPTNPIFRFFASYGLAVTIFVLMFFLILFGTLYQVDHGLFETQNKYFNSAFVIHKIGPVAIPLPGGYLLMVLLTINLVCGGFVRIRKSKYTLGVLIGHAGILVMLISSGVTFHFSDRGHMRLYPGEQDDTFYSYYDWNVEIGKPAQGATSHVISDELLKGLGAEDSRTFHHADLPFDVTVSRYAMNGVPVQTPTGSEGGARVIDGFRMEELPLEKESEVNVPAAYVTLTDKESGEATDGILWGLSTEPLTVQSGDLFYTVGLERKSYSVPFTVRVDDFRREVYAGTGMDASFEADVTKIEDGAEEKILIWMNHPLRHKGYTFFQASWGPPDPAPNQPLFTVFEVVRNPADQGPLVACIIVGIGLLIHFTQKLGRYMRAESKRRTA